MFNIFSGRKHVSKKIRRSREQISQYLEQFHDSGMTLTDFARQSGVHLTTLSSWLRKERQLGAQSNQSSNSLVPLRVQSPSSLKLVSPTGWSIEIPHDIPLENLRLLLTAVGASC